MSGTTRRAIPSCAAPGSERRPKAKNNRPERSAANEKKGLKQVSGSQEEDMPEDVDASVDQGGGEDGVGLAPGPAIDEAGDGGEEDVAPVRELPVVGDVRKAEEDGCGDPAGGVAVGGS